MKSIQKHITDKTVAIVAQGPSVKELEERIEDFRDLDIVWTSINQFNLVESIIEKIGKRFEIVYCSAPIRIVQMRLLIQEYLDRREDNWWITLPENNYRREKTIIDEGNPGHGKFNTLFTFILFLIKYKPRYILLFGADGGADGGNTYYRQEDFKLDEKMEGDFEDKKNQLLNDTKVVNARFLDFLNDCPYQDTEILNVSKDSRIECFDKYTYDEILNLLKGDLYGCFQ